FISPTRRRLPQAPYTPSGKWKSATGRTNQVYPSVSFDVPGQSRQGVSLRELKNGGAQLQGAGDRVLRDTGLKRITFRLLWPGYEHVEWCRSIVVVDNSNKETPITRAQLGSQVAANIARFFEVPTYETPSSVDWMINTNCVQFGHLYLVSLRNTFEDCWQADIALD
ncbi:hypothetical protein C8J57DRAFT_1015656, partial [Mycena rebaudengoi]